MSTGPTLLLTRPIEQARAFAAELAVRLGREPNVVFAPVMTIRARKLDYTPDTFEGVIVSSANGASHAPVLADMCVYCVGKRTSEIVKARGGRVMLTADNADELVAEVLRHQPKGPLVHFRGAHVEGAISERLTQAGIKTEEMITYDQFSNDLTSQAINLIEGDEPVILPLFSARTARLIGRAVDRLGGNLHVIGMSRTVATTWQEKTGGRSDFCARPTRNEMMNTIVAAFDGDAA